ncbi:MAG: hypothetical protein JNM65_04160 [Verrucomicrobiaceae bacterium]|nr:hypothetical protein [Verrucomicrobiaceae bacterium]
MLLSDAQQAHLRMLAGVKISPLNQAFLTWLLPSRCPAREIDGQIKTACTKRGGARSYRDVALAGFATAKIAELGLTSERDALVDWIQGTNVRSASGYDPIVDDPAGLLGVMLAFAGAGGGISPKGKNWLAVVCSEAATGESKETHSSTFRAIGHLLAETPVKADVSADIAVALQSKGLLRVDPASYSAAFTKAKVPAEEGDIYTAAVRLAALDWIQSQTAISIDRPDISQVRRVLEGVQSSLYRWVWEEKPRTSRRGAQPRKWHIENEYHFQSLLYAVLRPIFADLREEEYTPSVGTTQPRADLYIPSLKLVIEVKFWYGRDNSRELINQLAADASLYRAKGSEVQSVIPIIWDEGRRTEEHSVIQDGVAVLEGLGKAIFVNRPSTWL